MNERQQLLDQPMRKKISKMCLDKILILLSLFTVTLAQGYTSCRCSEVIVTMNKLYDKVERLIEPIAEKLALLEQPGHFPSHPASSCKEIIEVEQSSRSGYYWLRASNGSAVRMFCDMTRTCGGVTGGWMKVARLDMTNRAHQCPSSLSAHVQRGKRFCARKINAAGCTSVNYPTQGIGSGKCVGRLLDTNMHLLMVHENILLLVGQSMDLTLME